MNREETTSSTNDGHAVPRQPFVTPVCSATIDKQKPDLAVECSERSQVVPQGSTLIYERDNHREVGLHGGQIRVPLG